MSALFLAGVGMSVGGQVMQGISARDASKMQARLFKAQAEDDLFQASREKEATFREQLQMIRRGRAVKGAQLAKAGASGATTESFLPVMIDTAKELELERFNLAEQGKLRESEFRKRAVLNTFQARISKIRGKNALTASLMGAGGSALRGGALYKELYS